MNQTRKFFFNTFQIFFVLLISACGKGKLNLFKEKEVIKEVYPSNSGNSTPHRFLYVVSGNCYAGGLTVTTPSSYVISKFYLSNGAFAGKVIDFTSTPGDIPNSIFKKNQTEYYIGIENSGGRRLEKWNRQTGARNLVISYPASVFGTGTAFQWGAMDSSGNIVFSKKTAIEKYTADNTRVLSGSNPFISAPTGSCATSTSNISSFAMSPSGKIIFSHAGTSPNNKIAVIHANGFHSGGDCLSAQSAPNSTALPTAVLLHSSGDLLVSYGSTTTTSNFIYSYTYQDTTGAISSPVAAYTDHNFLRGPSAMTEDTETGHVYVANGSSTHNNIEKFVYDPSTKTLSRVGSVAFIPALAETKCISFLTVGD